MAAHPFHSTFRVHWTCSALVDETDAGTAAPWGVSRVGPTWALVAGRCLRVCLLQGPALLSCPDGAEASVRPFPRVQSVPKGLAPGSNLLSPPSLLRDPAGLEQVA